MLKKAKLEGDRDIAKEIGDYITKSSLKVSAEEVLTNDLHDTAFTTAKTYWMMGWSWAEIETVLYDLEYPEAVVKKLIKETQDYAKELLKDGPFNPYNRGQTVKLKNGHIAVLIDMSENRLTVEDPDHGRYVIDNDQIDVEASNKLAEAFKIRQSAKDMLSLIGQKYKLPPAPEVESKKDETKEYGFAEMPFSPAGMADIVPERGDARPINKKLEDAIKSLDGLESTQEALEEKISGIREKYMNPINREIKDIEAKKADALKKFYLVLNEIGEGVKGNEVLFRDYKGKLMAIRNEVKEYDLPPNELQELEALKGILQLNHPDIAEKTLSALNQWKEAANKVEKQVQKKVYVFPYRKEPKEEKEAGLTKEEIKVIWKEVRTASDDLNSGVLVKLEDINKELDKVLAKVIDKRIERKVFGAIKALAKR
jgi:hypothetical protein